MLMISVMASDFSVRLFGKSKMLLASYISILALPFIVKSIRHSMFLKKFSLSRVLFLEFALMIGLALYFIFISPLEGSDAKKILFSWTLEGRAITGSLRIFGDISIVVFLIFLIKERFITFQYIVNVVYVLAIIHIIIAVFDNLTGYHIKAQLVDSVYRTARPNGLTHEPKMLGRLLFGAFLMFFSLTFDKQRVIKIPKFALPITLFGILVTFSASTYIAGGMTIMAVLFFSFSIKNLKILSGVTVLLILIGVPMYNSELFQTMTLQKIYYYMEFVEFDRQKDEPKIFCYMEVFDRTSAYFFWMNPRYWWLGVGPNLISIPQANYMSHYYQQIWGAGTNGLPQTVIYYFSRTGVLGLFLYFQIFRKLRKRVKKLDYEPFNYMLVGIFVFTAFNNQIWFYVYLAIIFAMVTYCPDQLRPQKYVQKPQ